MSLVGISNIVVESNVRILPGVEKPLGDVEFNDLPENVKAEIKELAASIKSDGLLQPIVVKELKGGKYRLMAGWRRLMAHKYLKKTMIDVKSIKGKKEDEVGAQLVENVHRRDLNPMEVARSLDKIREVKGIKAQEGLAKYVNKSSAWVSQHLSLLKADEEVQGAVEDGTLGVGGARELVSLPKAKQRDALAKAKKEAEASGDVDKKSGKPKVKTKGARRQARRSKKKAESKQMSIAPVAEREKEQRAQTLEDFFAAEFGQKKVSKAQKELAGKFWDYLMEKGRLIIK